MTNSYQARARYFSVDDGFNVERPAIPPHIFLEERDEALRVSERSRRIFCDLSRVIDCPVEATAPLMQASYLQLAVNDPLTVRSRASTEVYYVIRGTGTTRWEGEDIHWSAGDVLRLPGGSVEHHATADPAGALLWMCTNEPLLAFEHARPLPVAESALQPVHYTQATMKAALAQVMTTTRRNGQQARSIMFGADGPAGGTISPAFTLALNSIAPRDHQRTHQHNSAAISLVLSGDQCFSMVGDVKVPWKQYATFLTPGAAPHSHHNPSDAEALLLIVQDGGLYYHCRTMGFAAGESAA